MLRITRGDDKSFGVQFPTGTDLTGCTVYFTVKPENLVNEIDPSDDNAIIKADESAHDHPSADPANGRTVITLSHEVTGADKVIVGDEYVYDFQIIDSGGKRKTWKKRNGQLDKCEITPESTQRPA